MKPGRKIEKFCGTVACYQRGCRCDKCKAAHAQRHSWAREMRYLKAGESTFTHGNSGYSNWRCRCKICSTAHQERLRQGRASRLARRETATFKHGLSGYNGWGCRCGICTQAMTEQSRRQRQKKRTVSTDPAESMDGPANANGPGDNEGRSDDPTGSI